MTDGGSRRARLREEALEEIKQRALRQLDAGGPAAVTLKAIARGMGMSGPAMYRYFDSRDALMDALVMEGFDGLARFMEATLDADHDSATDRLRAVCAAYRTWAIDHPERYALLLSTARGASPAAAEGSEYEAHRGMLVILAALAEVQRPRCSGGRAHELDGRLLAWNRRRTSSADYTAEVLRAGVHAWSRLHGMVSLELVGAYEAMGLDPATLYADGVDQIVAAAAE